MKNDVRESRCYQDSIIHWSCRIPRITEKILLRDCICKETKTIRNVQNNSSGIQCTAWCRNKTSNKNNVRVHIMMRMLI